VVEPVHSPYQNRSDHFDPIDVVSQTEHACLAALASVRALLPTQPLCGRCTMASPPLKTACGTEPRQRRAPHPRGASSRHAASPCRVERPERRSRQQRGGQRAPAQREGKLGKNNCHKIGKAKRSRSGLRGCGAESLLRIAESTQEKGQEQMSPIDTGTELRSTLPNFVMYEHPGLTSPDARVELLPSRNVEHVSCKSHFFHHTCSSTVTFSHLRFLLCCFCPHSRRASFVAHALDTASARS